MPLILCLRAICCCRFFLSISAGVNGVLLDTLTVGLKTGYSRLPMSVHFSFYHLVSNPYSRLPRYRPPNLLYSFCRAIDLYAEGLLY